MSGDILVVTVEDREGAPGILRVEVMVAAIQPIVHGTAPHNKVLCGPNINSAEVQNPCSGCWLFSHLGMGKVSLRELSNLLKAVQVVNGGAWT